MPRDFVPVCCDTSSPKSDLKELRSLTALAFAERELRVACDDHSLHNDKAVA